MANVIGTNHWDPENKWISISIPPANPGQTKPASAKIEVQAKNGDPMSGVTCTNPVKSWASSYDAAVTWPLDGATQPAGAPPPPPPLPTTSTVIESNNVVTNDKPTPTIVVSGTKTTYTFASTQNPGAETEIIVTMVESGGGL